VESSVIPIVDVMNEHRVYLPSVGIFIATGTALALLLARVRAAGAARALVITAAAVSVVLGVATFRRNLAWKGEIAIWSDAAQKSPGKYRPHLNLGTALSAAGRLDEGARELRRAVEIDPASSYARAQLGAVLAVLGRPAEAEPELREAVRLEPNDPEALFNLGLVLLRAGRADEAKPVMKRFLEVAPPAYAAARRIAERAQK
jgi:tetratricopeptide (TPR) repeat protein